MKFSEIKRHVKEWKRLGLKKIPRLDVWERTFYLGLNREGKEMMAKSAFTSQEMIYSSVSVSKMIEWHYERHSDRAKQKMKFK